MRMRRQRTIKALLPAVVATLAGLVAACGSAPPVPEDQYYRLKAVRAEPAAPGKMLFPGTIEIDRFVADGVTAGRPIVYSEAGKPYQVKEYHYHFWTQPPTVMLRDELISYLRAADVAKAIVTPEMRVAADYVLTGKIIRLEKVIGSPPKASLELELGVRKATGGALIFLKTYRIETASDGSGVDDAVHALNAALSEVYGQFVADLAKR
jgi:ABC-type uncharacterized transport system auxiliary subunit